MTGQPASAFVTVAGGARAATPAVVRGPEGFNAASTPQRCSHGLVFIPPLLEEMNRSRRLLTLLTSALAAQDCLTLLPDLPGTGESGQSLADTRWDDWLDSIADCMDWMAARATALQLCGLRGGALVAQAALGRDFAGNRQMAFTALAPVRSGTHHVRHWLRVRTAASREIGPEVTMDALKTQISNGQPVQLAGYDCPAGLLQMLETQVWRPDVLEGRRTLLIDVGQAASAGLPVTSDQLPAQIIDGPQVWQLAEPPEPADLATRLAALLANPR